MHSITKLTKKEVLAFNVTDSNFLKEKCIQISIFQVVVSTGFKKLRICAYAYLTGRPDL